MSDPSPRMRPASFPSLISFLPCVQDACRCAVTAEHASRLVERYSTPEYHAAAFCVASVQDKVRA